MPLDIDGAGRSSTLACLPTARGAVAPTRGQVFGGVEAAFFQVGSKGGLGGGAPPLQANFRTRGPESLGAGQAAQNFPSPPPRLPDQKLSGVKPLAAPAMPPAPPRAFQTSQRAAKASQISKQTSLPVLGSRNV